MKKTTHNKALVYAISPEKFSGLNPDLYVVTDNFGEAQQQWLTDRNNHVFIEINGKPGPLQIALTQFVKPSKIVWLALSTNEDINRRADRHAVLQVIQSSTHSIETFMQQAVGESMQMISARTKHYAALACDLCGGSMDEWVSLIEKSVEGALFLDEDVDTIMINSISQQIQSKFIRNAFMSAASSYFKE